MFFLGGGHGPMVSAVREAITGVQGLSPSEAETFLAFGRSLEAANLSTFSKIWKRKKSQIFVLSLQK